MIALCLRFQVLWNEINQQLFTAYRVSLTAIYAIAFPLLANTGVIVPAYATFFRLAESIWEERLVFFALGSSWSLLSCDYTATFHESRTMRRQGLLLLLTLSCCFHLLGKLLHQLHHFVLVYTGLKVLLLLWLREWLDYLRRLELNLNRLPINRHLLISWTFLLRTMNVIEIGCWSYIFMMNTDSIFFNRECITFKWMLAIAPVTL